MNSTATNGYWFRKQMAASMSIKLKHSLPTTEPNFRVATDEEFLRLHVKCLLQKHRKEMCFVNISVGRENVIPFIVTGCIYPIPRIKFTAAHPNDGEIIYIYVVIVPIANARNAKESIMHVMDSFGDSPIQNKVNGTHEKEYRFTFNHFSNGRFESVCKCSKYISIHPNMDCPMQIHSIDGRSFTPEFIRSHCLRPMKMVVTKSLSFRSDGCQYNASDSFNNSLEFDLNLYNLEDDDQSAFERDIRQKNKKFIKHASRATNTYRCAERNSSARIEAAKAVPAITLQQQTLGEITEMSKTTINTSSNNGKWPFSRHIDFIVSQNLNKTNQHATVFDYCLNSTAIPLLHFTEYRMSIQDIQRFERAKC